MPSLKVFKQVKAKRMSRILSSDSNQHFKIWCLATNEPTQNINQLKILGENNAKQTIYHSLAICTKRIDVNVGNNITSKT